MKRQARNVTPCASCGRHLIKVDGTWRHAYSRGRACGWLAGTYAHPTEIVRDPAWILLMIVAMALGLSYLASQGGLWSDAD